MRKRIRKRIECIGDMPSDGWREDSIEESGVLLFYYAIILEVIL